MKALSIWIVLSYSSFVVLASSSSHPHPHARRHDQHGNGMRLVKRQAGGSDTTTASSPAGAAPQPTSNAVASPAAGSTNNKNDPLDSLTQALQSSPSTSSPVTTEQTTNEPETSTSPNAASVASSSPASSVAPSSSSAPAPPASTSPSSIPASSLSTNARSTIVSIVTPSASLTSDQESSSLSASSSSSASALSDKKSSSSSSSGGIGHGTLIAIIVVASCVAGVGAIWTIIRKTKFSPSKRFESKLEPIDFVPEVPSSTLQSHNNGNGAASNRSRSQSQLSGVYGNNYYEASLARSDSKGSLRGIGGPMSEPGGGLASIPYQGPGAYAQPAYYGETANAYHGSPQLGYPNEQPTFYPALQRGLSSSSSLQQQASGLGRMNTTATMQGGRPAYDYGAQARSTGGGHHQYY